MKNNKNISRKDRLKSKRLAPANYLIVCEGKQTEPNYFNGLKKKINKNYGSKVDVLIPNIEIKGTKADIDNITKDQIKVEASVKELTTEGENSVDWNASFITPINNVSIVNSTGSAVVKISLKE